MVRAKTFIEAARRGDSPQQRQQQDKANVGQNKLIKSFSCLPPSGSQVKLFLGFQPSGAWPTDTPTHTHTHSHYRISHICIYKDEALILLPRKESQLLRLRIASLPSHKCQIEDTSRELQSASKCKSFHSRLHWQVLLVCTGRKILNQLSWYYTHLSIIFLQKNNKWNDIFSECELAVFNLS